MGPFRLPDAQLTITVAREPSLVGAALRSQYPEMLETADVWRHIALSARERLVLVVPFFDRHGAEMLLELFRATPAARRILVCRRVQDIRDAHQGLDVAFAESGVEFRCYWINHYSESGASTVETFHAKIALADGTAAYVGSANAMRSSLETTMECGFLVHGAAARQVRTLVDLLLGQTT
jgi:phosphatidylserine/phosphatidylglycerophosphate/cardiolipin synthase-like enzyme